MKNTTISLWAAIISLLTIQGCTKEETITKEFNPPPATLYGTWKIINSNPLDERIEYYIFPDNEDFMYALSQDRNGFRRSYDAAFSATNKQVNFDGGIFNYTIKNDTLKLINSTNYSINAVKQNTGSVSQSTWMNTASIIKTVDAPSNISSHNTVGINGDFLYLNSGYKVYKYNTLNKVFLDSIPTGQEAAIYYKNGFNYYGGNGSYKIMKTEELLTATASEVSTNVLNSVRSLSMNGTSNTIYAFEGNSYKLFAGTEGGVFSELFDFGVVGYPQGVVYYGNDEFLMVNSYQLYKVKISPTFKVIASYNIGNYNGDVYSVSTNGSDVWATVYSNGKYKYIKLNLN